MQDHNTTGQDYSLRNHFRFTGPIFDFHAHVTTTSEAEKAEGPVGGHGDEGRTEAARLMLEVGREFGIVQTLTMCAANDIAPLRAALGDGLMYNAMLNKKLDEPDDVAFRSLDAFLEAGIVMVKLWSAPRGRDRGLTVDAPWRIECLKRARAAGIKHVMVHVGDPDVWWTRAYSDTEKFGTKPDQYTPFRKMIEMFPDLTWIGAHMGGDPEHPDRLQKLLEDYPNLYFDTSATKWQVREVSRHPEAVKALVEKFPDRFFFGTDLVTRHSLSREHYESRYWCQRTLWESDWRGPAPIGDPDYVPGEGEPEAPFLHGAGLSPETLTKVMWGNAAKLLGLKEPVREQ